METPNTSTGTRGWIVAERTPQHGCELPPSWLAAPAPHEMVECPECCAAPGKPCHPECVNANAAELVTRFAHDPDDDLPVCEWCGMSVDDFTTLAFAPYCSAECRECDEIETVWALQHGPHTSPDQ